MSSVVNVKVGPKYQNLKEFMSDPNNEYIGRRGIVFIDGVRYPPTDSPWANPFKVGKDGTRDEVIMKYYHYICNRLRCEPELLDMLKQLKDKTLGCWCHPERCHGDVLVYLVNSISATT